MTRRGPLKVQVRSLWGVRKNTQVTLRQVSNEVLFGLGPSVFLYPKWQEELAKFSLATIPFYWGYIEPTQGKLELSAQRAIVDWCKSKGIKTKGHPVAYTEVLPSWKKTPLSKTDITYLISNIMSRFKDVDYWDVINEPIHTNINITEGYKLAESYSKNLIINEYGVLPTDSIGFKNYLSKYRYQTGLQCHIPQNERWDVDQVVAEVNKHNFPDISEVSITSAIENPSQKMLWDEQKQASYLTELYQKLFEQTNIRSITWWNLLDGDPWRPHIGLIRKDGTKKPAYYALENLIKGYKTIFTGTTNSLGELNFTGYYGVYEVVVGGKVKGKITLTNASPYATIRY